MDVAAEGKAEDKAEDKVVVRLDSARRTVAAIVAVLLTALGAVLIVLALAGIAGDTTGGRIAVAALGVLAIVIAMIVGSTLRRPPDTVAVSSRGFFVRRAPDIDFAVPWSEVAAARLFRERCHVGHFRVWFYRLEWQPEDTSFGERHPEMRGYVVGDHYVYSLGRVGLEGKHLYDAFRAHAPEKVLYHW